jgi:hypothetical protein
MRVLELSATASGDGKLRFEIPAEAGVEFEVAVIVQAKPPANGSAHAPTPEQRGWPAGYIEATYGSIQDETFVAPLRTPPRLVEQVT